MRTLLRIIAMIILTFIMFRLNEYSSDEKKDTTASRVEVSYNKQGLEQ
jgi:hypothetical protein